MHLLLSIQHMIHIWLKMLLRKWSMAVCSVTFPVTDQAADMTL